MQRLHTIGQNTIQNLTDSHDVHILTRFLLYSSSPQTHDTKYQKSRNTKNYKHL